MGCGKDNASHNYLRGDNSGESSALSTTMTATFHVWPGGEGFAEVCTARLHWGGTVQEQGNVIIVPFSEEDGNNIICSIILPCLVKHKRVLDSEAVLWS